jgi:hypothetical protein
MTETEELKSAREEIQRLKEGIDVALVILVNHCTDKERKMCYDYLSDIRYNETTQP